MHRFEPGFALRLTVFIGLAALAQGSHSQETSDPLQLSGSLTASSDYVFRGVSQTMGRPSLQALLVAESGGGFYAYGWASNIDFSPDSEPDDDARYEIDIAAGYSAPLGERWSIDTAFVRYIFPGTVEGTSYDYSEILTTFRLDDRAGFTVGFAKDVDGTDADARYYAIDLSIGLPFDLGAAVAAGYYDLDDAYGSAYSYATATVQRELGTSTLALSLSDTFGGAENIYYRQATGTRLVLSFEYAF